MLIINGPNLNLLGRREQGIYGSMSFEEYLVELRTQFPLQNIDYFQSNHEGAIIDKLHEVGFQDYGIILNAGGYTHTSIAIRDAISAIPAKVVEVHISNIYEREVFRHHSYIEEVCQKTIVGKGLKGYEEAIKFLLD